jgi:hypothetical protein
MSAAEATAEVFITAFKSLKPRQREAVLERMLAHTKLVFPKATTNSLLKTRRNQPRKSFSQQRSPLDELAAARQIANEFDAKEWQW